MSYPEVMSIDSDDDSTGSKNNSPLHQQIEQDQYHVENENENECVDVLSGEDMGAIEREEHTSERNQNDFSIMPNDETKENTLLETDADMTLKSQEPHIGSNAETAQINIGNENIPIDVDDTKSIEDEKDDSESEQKLTLGGDIDTPAYALLTGIIENEESSPCVIPIKRLPAILGRSHSTSDPSFIPLGKHKSISRYHFTIYYMDTHGGKIGLYDEEKKKNRDKLVYVPPNETSENEEERTVIQPNSDENDNKTLPTGGFFAIECLGKNKITVSGKKIVQGQVAMLQNGSTVQLSTHSLYFALPTFEDDDDDDNGESDEEDEDDDDHPKRTMKVPNPNYKRLRDELAKSSLSPPRTPFKRAKLETPDTAASSGIRTPKTEFDNLPVENLLSQMTQFILSNQWTKRQSILGSVISYHAVKDAAESPEMMKLAAQNEHFGVSRADIMKWIDDSPMYGTWASQMLSRIEIKSYQSNIGKSLIRAGYTRAGSIGRHSKWSLPKNLAPRSKLEEMRKQFLNEGGLKNDDDDDDDNDENEKTITEDVPNSSQKDVEKNDTEQSPSKNEDQEDSQDDDEEDDKDKDEDEDDSQEDDEDDEQDDEQDDDQKDHQEDDDVVVGVSGEDRFPDSGDDGNEVVY